MLAYLTPGHAYLTHLAVDHTLSNANRLRALSNMDTAYQYQILFSAKFNGYWLFKYLTENFWWMVSVIYPLCTLLQMNFDWLNFYYITENCPNGNISTYHHNFMLYSTYMHTTKHGDKLVDCLCVTSISKVPYR